MNSFRDIKRRARRDVHATMRVSALYFADPDDTTSYVEIYVRPHTKFTLLGDMTGTNYHAAEREEVAPRIIFMRDEMPSPARLSIVSIGPGEAYQVDHTQPPDGITITALVSQLSQEDADLYPFPQENI